MCLVIIPWKTQKKGSIFRWKDSPGVIVSDPIGNNTYDFWVMIKNDDDGNVGPSFSRLIFALRFLEFGATGL